MNRNYRLIWNHRTGTWVAVAESVRARATRASRALVASALSSAAAVAVTPAVAQVLAPSALPTGAQVISGTASVDVRGAGMTVQQSSDRLITNWQSFNIGSQATVSFEQPSAGALALNRVIGQEPSQILGRLISNGHVMLVNPAGVVFGRGAQVDVGALTASSLAIDDRDFLAGRYRFTGRAGGAVENLGSIATAHAGSVAFIAPIVRNDGSIRTPGGSTVLAAGHDVEVDFVGDGLVTLRVSQSAIDALVENEGLIRADDGMVILTARAADTLARAVVNNSGLIEAKGLSQQGGRIVLDGGDAGVRNAATLDASSAQGSGGSITLSGEQIELADGAWLDARGATGGGSVRVGGGWQGSGDLPQAAVVTMAEGAHIDVSATDSGAGGTAVLWSDLSRTEGSTQAHGSIAARGGPNGGDGGQVETSGHRVAIDGIRVDAGAEQGVGGLWLIDPYNYIVGAPEAATLAASLNAGTSVTVDTASNIAGLGASGNSADAGDIRVTAAIAKTSGGDATLTFKAARHIDLQSGADISASAGKLNLQLWADSDNSGDGINVVSATSLATNGGWVKFGNNQKATINGASVFVGGDVYFSGNAAQTLSTSGGAFDIYGETILGNTAGLTIATGGGNVGLHGLLNSGNRYTWVDKTSETAHDWNWARSDARDGTAGGATTGDSYLVTITSRLENAIAGLTAGYRGAWIGAYRADPATSFDWTWSDGPEAGRHFFTQVDGGGGTTVPGLYANFAAVEPNGVLSSSSESVGQFFGTAGQWNDLSKNTLFSPSQSSQYDVLGYVRETNLSSSPLTIDAGSGHVTFGDSVGANKALAALTVSGPVTLPAIVTTVGAQTYNGAATMGQHTSLSSDGSDITFNATFDSDSAATPRNLTATSANPGTVRFNGLVGSTGALGAVTVNAALQTTADIRAGASLAVSGPSSLGADVTTSDAQSYAGALTLTSDVALTTTGNGNISATSAIDGAHSLSATTAGSGGITLGGAVGGSTALTGLSLDAAALSAGAISLALNAPLDVTNRGAGTISGAIAGTGTALSKSGGGTLVLSGTNTYTGATTVTGGTLSISADANLGTAPGAATAGHVVLDGGTLWASSSLTLDSRRGIALGAGDGTLGAATGSTLSYGGVIAGSGALTTSGSGSVSLSGASTYTGATTVSAGTLVANHASALGSLSALTLADTAGAGLSLLADLTVGSLTGGGSAGGHVALNARTLTVGGSDDSTSYGGVVSGTGGLVKTGTGSLTLTANSSYTGATTIDGGSLVLRNDVPVLSTSGFGGTGALTIEPVGASFGAAFSLGQAVAASLSALTIGKSTNSAGITVAAATSVAGPITIYGGDIAINAALQATGTQTITLQSSGNVTDGPGGHVSADKLALKGSGNFTLDAAGNAVGTLAAGNGGGAPIGSLTYVDSDALSIGTAGVSGITASGPVSIGTRSGDLMVGQSITTSDTGSAAIVLNAGIDAAAGTASGGDVVVGGGATLTTGANGRALVYTGSVAGSTGLTARVGAGSGKFRYDSDEATSGYSTPLGADGTHAIYREQPSVSGTVASLSTTYGDALPGGSGLSGAVNGDDPYMISGRVDAGSGHIRVGSYTLTASTGLNGLGYAVGSITPGTLTVSPLALGGSISSASSLYGAALAAGTASLAQALSGDDLGSATVAVLTAGLTSGSGQLRAGTHAGIQVVSALSGADAGNYSVANVRGDYTVAPLELGITGVTAQSKTYDANTSARLAGAATVAARSGDSVTLGGGSGRFADADVGEAKPVTVSGFTLSGPDAGNYTLLQPAGLRADITPRTQPITTNSRTTPPVATSAPGGASSLLQAPVVFDPATVGSSAAPGTVGGAGIAANGAMGRPGTATTVTATAPGGSGTAGAGGASAGGSPRAPAMVGAVVVSGGGDGGPMTLQFSADGSQTTASIGGGAATVTRPSSDVVSVYDADAAGIRPSGVMTLSARGTTVTLGAAAGSAAPPPELTRDGMRMVTVDYRLPAGNPTQVTVGISEEGVLLINVPAELRAGMPEQQIILVGVMVAKQRLDVEIDGIKAVVLQTR